MVMSYLNFTGNCEEAFHLYQKAFDGKTLDLVRYSDAPEGTYPDMDAEQKNKIMHGTLMFNETGGICGADAIWSVEKGATVYMRVYCASAQKAQYAFNILAEHGETISKLEKTPPPHDDRVVGMVKDRYGFTWVLVAPIL